MSYSEPLAASAAAMTQQLDEDLCAELLPILSEPEALIVAELLERIATDETSDLRYVAQLVIVRIYDRLETSQPRPSPAPPEARGTVPQLKAARTLTTLFGPARRRAC